jgi:putative transcription factor
MPIFNRRNTNQETNLSFHSPQIDGKSTLNCDICGRQIDEQSFKVIVEGAKMLVCRRCQALGEPYQEETRAVPRPVVVITGPVGPVRVPRTTPRKSAELPKDVEELEVADNYPEIVRKRRMKLGLSQEELANRVKEKLSVIQKIETGKVAPNTRLCRLLEHELKVKLLVPLKESEIPKSSAPTEVTLGDIVKIRGKSENDLTKS